MEGKKRKSRIAADVKFWGEFALETIGITAAVALVMMLFYGIGIGGSAGNAITLFPYYLFIAGAFAILMTGIGCFQQIFSVLMSMNVTRRSVVRGMLLSEAGVAGCILLISAAIWKLIPSEISESGMKLLPLMAGVLLGGMSIIVILGIAVIRWGRKGMILASICYGIMGAALGIAFSSTGEHENVIRMLTGFQFKGILAGGIILYLISAVFAFVATRRMEVRV